MQKGRFGCKQYFQTVPPKKQEWIKWIQDRKAIRKYKKDKVLSLINSLRTNPEEAERKGLNLDSAAKIKKNLENPGFFAEKFQSDTKFSLRGSTPCDKQMEKWKEENHL